MSRGEQHEWDRISLAILIIAIAIICCVLVPAVMRATAKGDELTAAVDKEDPLSIEDAQVKPFSLHIPCVVTEVVDGDTVTVEIVLQARVRLRNCWAPELRTNNEVEKAKGLASKQHLQEVAELKGGGLIVRLDGAKRLGDVFSFDRIVGDVWIDQVGDLAHKQCLSGHAFRTKDELLEALRTSEGL